MCQPTYYDVKYEINPWMNIKYGADKSKAIHQWQHLFQTIIDCGAQIEFIAPAIGWPDMVFTANGGLFYQEKIILPHFKYKERQGELPYLQTWFIHAGFELANYPVMPNSPYFEGAGDALLAGNTLFAGYGFRSERKFYEEADYLDLNNIIYCELIDPYFYHIDTCFCPLNEKLAIWYPPAFTKESQKRMEEKIELLSVTDEEAKYFACNAIVLHNKVIIPMHCHLLTNMLENREFTVYACDMSEFLKAGGACKCLTLRID
jgi:N-dimethylarginine dimethylaminohydrolase